MHERVTKDVLQAPRPMMEFLRDKGVMASYRSPAAVGYPEWTKKDEKIQIFGIEYVSLIYNKELVKPGDILSVTRTWQTPSGRERSSWPTPLPMQPPFPGSSQ